MQKILFSTLVMFASLLFLTACGGGGGTSGTSSSGGDGGGGDISGVIVDPQAYYVDAVEGSDDNDGKSPQSAWKSLAKLNSITINAGNKILFRTGQTWHGQLNIKNSGTANNPIVIGSYGQGTQPVLSALGIVALRENNNNNDVEDGEWIPYNAVGGNGLSIDFKEPVTDPGNTWLAVILDSHPDRIKVNGQEVLGAFDSTELSNTFKWSYNRDKGGTVFYWYGNDKPSAIETNIYTAPLYIHDNAYVQVENLTLVGGYVASAFLENTNNISVKNCTLGDMSKQGVYVKAESTVSQNITIDRCTIDSKYRLDYSMAQPNLEKNGRTTTTRGASEGIIFWGGVQNSTVSNNFIKNWTHANINFSTGNEEELSNNIVHDNQLTAPDIAYGGRIGVDGKNTHNNEFYANTIKDIKAPNQFNGHDNYFHDNRVEDVKESPLKPAETGYAIIIQGYASPVYNNRIINNTFKNIAKNPPIKIADNNLYPVHDNTITPNTYE